MAIKPIQILINAKDNASGVFDKLSTKVAAVGAAIAGYFGVQAFIGAVKGAADFEQAISRVQAATGATGDELARLKKTAEDAGANTTFTSTQAAGALENLAKAGLDANQAIETLPAVLALAQAGDIELGTASEYVTKAVMGMGLAFSDAARVADVLALGANATNTSVEGLAQALSYAAPVAQSMGVSLESTVAILGKMADAGIDASRAGTSLNNIMSQFSDPASAFRRELAAAGITTTNFEKALHQLAGAGAAGDKAIAAVGLNAGPALRALLGQGMGALDELTGKLNNATGSAAETARVMQANLKGSITGLSSAWDTLKNVLLTPVLPVLKDGVDKLAESFRNAVASGVVEKFGQAIATGFKGAIEWARQFAASFDWDATAARLTQFAADTQDTLGRIGQYATNASNVVQTAWGVMGAGIDVIKSGIYAMGSAFSGVAAGINSGAALIMEGLAKITFGDVAKRFAAMAADMRVEASALGGVAQDLSDAALAAIDSAADHARSAADGFAGLTGSITSTARAAAATVGSFTGLGAAAQEAGAKATAAAQQQGQAAQEAAARVRDLRAEYQQAIDTGNLQRATEIMVQLKAATQAAAGSQKDLARQAKDAAAAVTAAFTAAGIQTKAELGTLASVARQQFETIKASGQATTEGLATAWKRAADAAIAANNGIAPSWVQAEAAVHNYRIESDAAGRASVQAADQIEQATGRAAEGWHGVARAAREASAEQKAAMEAARKNDEYMASRFQQGWAKNADGNTVVAREDTALRNQRLAAMFGADMIGNQNAEAAYNLTRRIEQLDKNSFGAGDGSLGLLRQELARLTDAMERDRAAARTQEQGGRPAVQPAAANDAMPSARARPSGTDTGAGATYISNITIGGQRTTIRTADAQSQAALDQLLRDLGSARGVAA